MRALLIGNGKTGKEVARLAPQYGITIEHIVTKKKPTIPTEGVDVAIDFSHEEGFIERLETLLQHNIPLVTGTTGWNDRIDQAKSLTEKHKGAVLAAPNFSVGAFLFSQILRFAGKKLAPHNLYDPSVFEIHHKNKQDAPSGTAKKLSSILEEEFHQEIPTSSLRSGHNPGEHQILFDSIDDTITLTHKAKNREPFAKGALLAAQWIQEKQGFFTLEDML